MSVLKKLDVDVVVIIGVLIMISAVAILVALAPDSRLDCAKSPVLSRVSSSSHFMGPTSIVGLDADGAVWKKVGDGCWVKQ